MADLVEIWMELRNVAQVVSGAKQASGAMQDVGEKSETAGKRATIGWKGILKWAGAAGVAYGATKFLRGAADATEGLAKSTLALQRQTNLDTKTASEWVGVLKERNISTQRFQVGLKTLSKQMEASRTGTVTQTQTVAALRAQIDAVAKAGGKDAPKQLAKLSSAISAAETKGAKARETMQQLGIPLADIQKGNTSDVLLRLADAMQKMRNPAERSALAQKLLGRSGIDLLPVLMQGRKGIQAQLNMQQKYGNYIDGKGMKSAKSLIQQQRELHTAFSGLQVQLGQAMLPVMLTVSKVILALANALRPITSRATVLKLVILGVVAALVALKIATIAQAAAEGEITLATKAWTIAQWLLNAAMDANPLVLVTALIVALGVAFYVAYKKVGWFRDAVNATWQGIVAGAQFVWNWIKANWPYLLGALAGPFGLAVVVIAKHFRAIKQFALDLVDAIKGAFRSLLDWVRNIPKKIGGIAKHIPGFHAASSALGWAKGALAEGGLVRSAGPYLVGEKGPEVVGLPTGSVVQPLTPAVSQKGGRDFVIQVPVVIDGREVALAVARVNADRLARR